MLYKNALEDLDHILWHCQFTEGIWGCFDLFEVPWIRNRDFGAVMEEVLWEGRFLWLACFFAIM